MKNTLIITVISLIILAVVIIFGVVKYQSQKQTEVINSTKNGVRNQAEIQGKQENKSGDASVKTDKTEQTSQFTLPIPDGGLCLVRDTYTSMPSASDPDVGKGYAKLTKVEWNSIKDLQRLCTEEDYTKLMQAYCTQNKNPVQFQVAEVNMFGGVDASACSQFGCGFVSCPQ